MERLRLEVQRLAQENESYRQAAAYGSSASPSGPVVSGRELTGSPVAYVPYGAPATFIGQPQAATSSSQTMASAPVLGLSHDPVVVVVPYSIREIRRTLHEMFAPLLDIPVISNPQTHLAALANLGTTLPSPLKPTQLQLTTPHHAFIDMIPSPTLRDRLIAIGPANSNTFLMEVCTITCGIEDTGQMTVWGEDWTNEFAWEFSAAVLERWGGWLLSPEWGQRANFWRRQRSAPLLPDYD